MMDNLYYSPYNVMFVLGLILFISGVVLLIVGIIVGERTNEDNVLFFVNFSENFSKREIWVIILMYLGNIVIQFIENLLKIFTIYYFSPNHLLINLDLSKLFNFLSYNYENKKYFSIIPFILQFFFLMIYLEIIELNFCNLNRN